MYQIIGRKIGAGILDFYAFSIVTALFGVFLKLLGVESTHYLMLSILILTLLGVVFYHVNTSRFTFLSIGELYFGIVKYGGEIQILKYDFNRILDVLGVFLILIPFSNLFDDFLDGGLHLSNFKIFYILTIDVLTFYSLINYKKNGGIKNVLLIIGLTFIIYYQFSNLIVWGIDFAVLPMIVWGFILLRIFWFSRLQRK